MAGGSETIREFLVSLGFKMDENSLRKFSEGIEKATKTVFTFAAALETTALAVAASVARFSSNLEQLYFASIRVGTSVTNLKALDKAAQDFGADAGEAVASVEGLAHALRVNPGNVGLLQGLGVQLKTTKDGTVDALDALLQLSKVFKQQPLYVAEQYAQMLGISEKTLLAMRAGQPFINDFNKFQKELKTGGFEKAAADAHRFMQQMRDLETVFQAFGAQVFDALQNKLGFSLKDLTNWLEKNGPKLASQVADAAIHLIDLAGQLKDKLVALVDWFEKLDKATGGWSTRILLIAAALKVSGAGSLIGGVLSLAGAFMRLAGGIGGAAAALAVFSGFELWQALKGKETIVSQLADKFATWMSGEANSLGSWFYNLTHRNEEAMLFFQNKGWSKAQAAGIVANIQAESGFRTGAENQGHLGLGQWDAARQAEFKRVFGKDMRDSSLMDQMEFYNYELRNHPELGGQLLSAAQTADQSARIVRNYFERPGFDPAEENRRAALATSIAQDVTINVDGAGDPTAVAERVAAALKRNNSELARNLAPAVQ